MSLTSATSAVLHDLLRLCPASGAQFRHYKGELVTVVGRAIDEASQRPMVLYQAHPDNVIWARLLSVWIETVVVDDQPVPRFAPVENPRG